MPFEHGSRHILHMEIGLPLPNILYAMSISPTCTVFSGIFSGAIGFVFVRLEFILFS